MSCQEHGGSKQKRSRAKIGNKGQTLSGQASEAVESTRSWGRKEGRKAGRQEGRKAGRHDCREGRREGAVHVRSKKLA